MQLPVEKSEGARPPTGRGSCLLGAILGVMVVLAISAALVLVLLDREAPGSPTFPASDQGQEHVQAYETRKARADATRAAKATSMEEAVGPRQPTATMGLRRAMIQTQQATIAIGQLVNGQTCQPLASGVIIDPVGLVVTSEHGLTESDSYCIACTHTLDGPPYWCFNAWVIKRDPDLDLALLSIETTVDGAPLETSNLPAVPLGDSNLLRIGDTLYVFGYPDVGGESITVTKGLVSGFEQHRTLIKTDAEISSGSSGGAAINENGRLIGIPIQIHQQATGKLGYLISVNEVQRFLR